MQACTKHFCMSNGVQSNNTTCIFPLYKIIIMCINILHDLEEQCVMHLILMKKKVVILNQMFYKITSHKFHDGSPWAFKLYLIYNLGGIPYATFMPTIEDSIHITTMPQTWHRPKLDPQVCVQSHHIVVAILPSCCKGNKLQNELHNDLAKNIKL